MSEIQKLLNELKNMKGEDRANHIANTRDVWSKIGAKNLESAGFESEADLVSWLEQNEFSNIA